MDSKEVKLEQALLSETSAAESTPGYFGLAEE
jgi:hypothetical protein